MPISKRCKPRCLGEKTRQRRQKSDSERNTSQVPTLSRVSPQLSYHSVVVVRHASESHCDIGHPRPRSELRNDEPPPPCKSSRNTLTRPSLPTSIHLIETGAIQPRCRPGHLDNACLRPSLGAHEQQPKKHAGRILQPRLGTGLLVHHLLHPRNRFRHYATISFKNHYPTQ